MCILVFKPKNIEFPTKEALQNCFENNPDGSGYAWIDHGISHIRKGFLTFNDFYASLEKDMKKLIGVDVALHFRFATHGSVIEGNCHPFPVSCNIRDLKAVRLDGKFKIMAHNGIISSLGKRAKKTKSDLSDTMVFAKELRSFGENHKNNRSILESGKFVIMDQKGSRRYGHFIEDNGIFYSNDGYLGLDVIWPYTFSQKGKKSFEYFDIKPCKIDINKRGECIYSKYCLEQGFCDISGKDFIDILSDEEYTKICPVIKDPKIKDEMMKEIEYVDEYEHRVTIDNQDYYYYY